MALAKMRDDIQTYCSDAVYEGTRQKDDATSARHLEAAKKALARRRTRVRENA